MLMGPMMDNKITKYQDYWPEYLREHSQPSTRMMHYLQTTLGGMAILYFLFTQQWIALFITLAMIFTTAFFTHIIFEKNKPAAFEYPFWWSVLNDIRMLFHFLTGTLKPELEKAMLNKDEN